MDQNREVRVLHDASEMSRVAADEFLRLAGDAIQREGRFTIALSGGSTPKLMYSLLASDDFRSRVPWDKIHFFWGDERHVPPDHPDSNYRMTREAMLSKVPVPAENIHRVESENPDAAEAARLYQEEIVRVFSLKDGPFPRFDMVLLGLGPDGHTASLFPHTAALQEQNKIVTANWVEKFNTWRITLTAPALNAAAYVMFLAGGAEKVETLKAVLEGPLQPDLYPSQMIRPVNGKLIWLVDEAAAKLLTA